MRMLHNKVLVRMRDRQAETKSGIVIPDRYQKTETWGVVEAAGPDCVDVAVNDIVHVGERQGTHMVLHGVDHIILPEPQIVCKIVDEAA